MSVSRAIVLGRIPYQERDMIVWLYSEAYGRISTFVRGSKSSKGNNGTMRILQPLMQIEARFSIREGRRMQRLLEARLLRTGWDSCKEVKKTIVAMFIADLLTQVLKEEVPNPELYQFLEQSIEVLELLDEGTENFHLIFMAQFAKYMGLHVEAQQLIPYIEKSCADFAHNILNAGFSGIGSVIGNRQQRNTLTEGFLTYFRHQHEGIGELRSLPVLQAMFA